MRKRYKRQLKIRESAIGLFAFITLGLAIIVPQSASAVSLKYNAMVEDNVIKLSDIFTGLEIGADKVLGPAPQPGHDMTLNARTLMRIAVAMDLPWRPASAADQVVLSRAATVITPMMIEDTLKNELSAQGMDGKFDISIISGVHEIILPYNEDQSVEIESINFKGDKSRFDAVLVAPSRENQIARERISGTIQRLVEIPVLRAPMKNGDVIRVEDLDFVTMRNAFVKHDMVLSAGELIGSTPRRIVLAGQPVKTNEIEPPQVVQRGERVTLMYKSGVLSLTAEGKALENGAKGDMIRVVNSASNRTLEAMVTGYKEVMVQSY